MIRIALALLSLLPLPLQAQEFMASYVGHYVGEGTTVYPDGTSEPVSCRMSLEDGGLGKITIREARCEVAGVLMNLRGAMAHAGGDRYEALVTSNIGFSGGAVGRKVDDTVLFTISDSEIGNGSLALVADLALVQDMVLLDIDLISNLTGALTEARIPLSRR